MVVRNIENLHKRPNRQVKRKRNDTASFQVHPGQPAMM